MKKILFIEDEFTLQKTFGEFLKKEGYEMISALDGETGLRLAKTKKPDLVLLDLILPRLQGFDLLEQLKGNPGTKNIPVIVLTNLETPEGIDRVLAAGATTYLLKTQYTFPELVEKIKKAIGDK
jgi:DNA-binding response OmpR family regulator